MSVEQDRARELANLDGHSQLSKVVIGTKFTDGSKSSVRQLKPLPPDLARPQGSAIALKAVISYKAVVSYCESKGHSFIPMQFT
jgi:hypothetical protein